MTPITHGGTDRGYKLCKCAKCGIEHQCTPTWDFYTIPEEENGPLYCRGCLWRFTLEKQRLMDEMDERFIENRIKEMKK